VGGYADYPLKGEDEVHKLSRSLYMEYSGLGIQVHRTSHVSLQIDKLVNPFLVVTAAVAFSYAGSPVRIRVVPAS
jgi:hypothetical protein